MSLPQFSLSHFVAPQLSFEDFLKLSESLGIDAVEIFSSDIPEFETSDHPNYKIIVEQCRQYKIKILGINALYPFDVWNQEREEQAIKLFKAAQEIKANGVVCWPLNDAGDKRSAIQRKEDLQTSLAALKKIAQAYGVKVFVEPVGFVNASLRFKPDLVEAIDAVGGKNIIEIVQDTFHHYASHETQSFPEYTGLVHISGVIDPAIPLEELKDEDRYLVDDKDVSGCVAQLKYLLGHGYRGYASFEPFALPVINSPTLERDLQTSLNFIKAALA